METLAAFSIVAVVVIVTPGPDTAVTIRNTLLGGRRSVFTAIGVSSGQMTWAVATSAGLAALLVSEPVFRAVKLIGAAYLAFLGAQALLAALRRGDSGASTGVAGRAPRVRPPVGLRQGLVSNLTNPKMAAFFPALLPQFAPEGGPTFVVLLLLGLTFSLMTLSWLTGYEFVVAKAGDFLRRLRIRRALEAATGAVLVALGVRLATEDR